MAEGDLFGDSSSDSDGDTDDLIAASRGGKDSKPIATKKGGGVQKKAKKKDDIPGA